MTELVSARLYTSDGATELAVLENSSARTWLDEINSHGIGSLQLPIIDPLASTIDYNQVVIFALTSGDQFAAFIETIDRNIVGEAGDRYVSVQGRGLLAWLEAAVVLPAPGTVTKEQAGERFFNFASIDSFDHDLGVTWGIPGSVAWEDRTGILAGYPLDWPDVICRWIWSGRPYGLFPRLTQNWFRRRFSLTDATALRLFATADSGLDVYVDGESILEVTHTQMGQWRTTWTADLELPAGDHVIAIRGQNGSMPYTDTPAGVIAELVSLTTDGTPDTVIVRTSSRWQVTTSEPKWLAGDILYTLVTEAQARGAGKLEHLTLDFDAAVDSRGAPWTTQVSKSWRIGFDNLLTVALDLAAEGIDIWVTPDRVLHAAETRGQVLDVDLTDGQNVAAWTISGQRAQATHGWFFTTKGWVEAINSPAEDVEGRLEIGIELGNTDSEADARRVALAAFRKLGYAQETVTGVGIVPMPGAVPGVDFTVGDVVNGIDAAGSPDLVRVLAINVSEDPDTAAPQFAPEFEAYRPDRPSRFRKPTSGIDLAIALRQAFPGSLRGKVRQASPTGSGAGGSGSGSGAGDSGGSGDGGGTASSEVGWFEDRYDITAADLGPFNLSWDSVPTSEDVRIYRTPHAGTALLRGDDFTITRTGRVLEFNPDVFDGIGSETWPVTVQYQYNPSAGVPYPPGSGDGGEGDDSGGGEDGSTESLTWTEVTRDTGDDAYLQFAYSGHVASAQYAYSAGHHAVIMSGAPAGENLTAGRLAIYHESADTWSIVNLDPPAPDYEPGVVSNFWEGISVIPVAAGVVMTVSRWVGQLAPFLDYIHVVDLATGAILDTAVATNQHAPTVLNDAGNARYTPWEAGYLHVWRANMTSGSQPVLGRLIQWDGSAIVLGSIVTIDSSVACATTEGKFDVFGSPASAVVSIADKEITTSGTTITVVGDATPTPGQRYGEDVLYYGSGLLWRLNADGSGVTSFPFEEPRFRPLTAGQVLPNAHDLMLSEVPTDAPSSSTVLSAGLWRDPLTTGKTSIPSISDDRVFAAGMPDGSGVVVCGLSVLNSDPYGFTRLRLIIGRPPG